MRIITSIECSESINRIIQKLPFKSKAQLLRIAITKSLHDGVKKNENYKLNRNGFEINTDTLFGDKTELFNLAIIINYELIVKNPQFLNDIITFHIEDGVKKILDEMQYLKKDIDLITYLQEST